MSTLRDSIRDVLAESAHTNPADVAGEVCSRIPDSEVRVALLEAVTGLVRQVSNVQRSASFTQVDRPSRPEPLPPAVIRSPEPIRGHARSAKRDAVADWWQGILRERIHVGDGRWAFLGDANRTDLLYAAQERHAQALKLDARAAQFEAVAALMVEHSVIRVRDLPRDALAASLRTPAAA